LNGDKNSKIRVGMSEIIVNNSNLNLTLHSATVDIASYLGCIALLVPLLSIFSPMMHRLE